MGSRRVNKGKTSAQFPDYITKNGCRYEKISTNSVEIELDIEKDVLKQIDQCIDAGEYVSRGDAIRDILRKTVEKLNKK